MVRCIAVLSDVHGHLTALETVLKDALAAGAETFVVAGDMVGLGPQPDQVFDRLCSLDARMIRGNHEADYVAPFDSPNVPPEWLTETRFELRRWEMATLGRQRRAMLAALPDRLQIDELTLVVHGSPRHMRDAVSTDIPTDVLEARYADEKATMVFSGHSHKPLIRDLPDRRLVNVGSVGLPLDGDPRPAYALIRPDRSGRPGAWQVEQRRLAYDIDAAVAKLDGDFRDASPEMAAMIERTVRRGIDYVGRAMSLRHPVSGAEFRASLQKFLGMNP